MSIGKEDKGSHLGPLMGTMCGKQATPEEPVGGTATGTIGGVEASWSSTSCRSSCSISCGRKKEKGLDRWAAPTGGMTGAAAGS